MRITDYYEGVKGEASFIFVRAKPLPNSQVSVVGCPSCNAPIIGIRRYGRRIKSTQVALCLKNFETVQSATIYKTEATFSRNQDILEMIPLISDGISELVSTSAQEVIQKNLQAMWQMFSGAMTSNGPSGSSSQQNEDLTVKSNRVLGSFSSEITVFPNTDIGSLFLYGIPEEQVQIWTTLIAPALHALKAFHAVHMDAIEAPSRRLFEASAAHLYNFKTKSAVVSSSDAQSDKSIRLMMEERARECGLPPDGHAGSSFVRSIQGRCDVLLLVLHTAMKVFEKISLKVYHDHPSASGWSKYVEDLLLCSAVHNRMLRDAAVQGRYYWLEMHAKMSLLDIYLKRMQWLGHRPFDRRHILRKLNREAAVNDTLTQFKTIFQEIQDGDQTKLWKEHLPRTRLLNTRMERACKIALGELKYIPAHEAGTVVTFCPKQIELPKTGSWHRCPNGHWHMIASWLMAVRTSTCPDCDTCTLK
ncbi:hypothetical protein EC968_006426 [Mortierella alpina]|nr:hypothetical protein EC968_006426 [Mortierella alpina]